MDPTVSHVERRDVPLKTLLWRGWRKRCPRCGEGPLYRRWLTLHDRCPVCGLRYLADQGDLFGLMVLVDRAFFLIPFITVFCFCLPNPRPWVYLVSCALMIFLLLFTLPNRNGASLAFDYYLRRDQGKGNPDDL